MPSNTSSQSLISSSIFTQAPGVIVICDPDSIVIKSEIPGLCPTTMQVGISEASFSMCLTQVLGPARYPSSMCFTEIFRLLRLESSN